MALLKLKTLCVIALSMTLAGGGFGFYALSADEKKPAGEKPVAEKPTGEKPKPEKPDGDKPKPEKPAVDKPKPEKPDGQKPKPEKPDGDKPKPEKPAEKKPGLKFGGKVASVDPKENTIMLAVKGDGGVVEKLYPVAADAKVFVDGKEAKLADVPKNSTASFNAVAMKDGELPKITELRVTGSTFGGIVKEITADTVTLEGEKNPRSFKLAPIGKVTVNGKDAKLADIKVGDKVAVTLVADESAALLISTGTKPDGEKPAAKPAKFGGKVADVDRTTRTITLAPKGEGAKEIVVRLTPDAKIIVDGIEKKIGDIQKGAFATFNLVNAKDGQPREANEVVVAGPTFTGVIKQIDTTTITIGTEKNDRVFKLATTGKVMIGEKEGKLADLKVGDKVSVTMSSDESAAVLIVSGVKKPAGDKPPKPDKDDDDPDNDQ